jgi:quercetin dioxygenase-like cupin family protein
MIIKKYYDVKAEPVPESGAEKATLRWVISEKDGAKNFFMRVFEIEPGGCTPLHQHPWEHEMFVFQGEGSIVREGKEVNISEGEVIFIPPDEVHQIKNPFSKTLKLICLIPSRKQ